MDSEGVRGSVGFAVALAAFGIAFPALAGGGTTVEPAEVLLADSGDVGLVEVPTASGDADGDDGHEARDDCRGPPPHAQAHGKREPPCTGGGA